MSFRLQASQELAVYLPRVSVLVADRLGLHFPPERYQDLAGGVAGAAHDARLDVADFARGLLSGPLTPEHLRLLAGHLTIGETYFFREPATWAALRQRVLPDLIAARRGRDQRLRFWSAACSSGEEPFSLAILLHELLPDLASWDITILATDINPRFLRKAAAGVYGEWSFRGTPTQLKQRYFTRASTGQYAIRDGLRQMVTFDHVNLVEDAFPSLIAETNAMDVIICRNMLMYFTSSQIDRVIAKLHRSIVDGGWLVVSPSEASHTRFPQFAVTNFADAILFRKIAGSPTSCRVSRTDDAHIRHQPRAPRHLARLTSPRPPRPHQAQRVDFALRTRTLANEGRLAEALTSCDEWIASDRLSAPPQYVRAMILLERGDAHAARVSLQRALYLDPKLVLAHVALASVALERGDNDAAARHVANARRVLADLSPDAILPDSDGLTAGRLAQTLTALAGLERAT